MGETLLETQLRLLLEQQCARAFKGLAAHKLLKGKDLTLLFVDYGQGGNVAFKTSLDRMELIATFDLLVESWHTGKRRAAYGPVAMVHTRQGMEALASEVLLPPGVGFGLLVGRGSITSYIARADREGMQATIESVLLPEWKGNR